MLETILESNLVAAIIALIGVIISLKWSTSETTKRMNQALDIYRSKLERAVYVSSKRADMEFEIISRINCVCGDIDQLMQRFYPDKISTYEINYEEKPSKNELALKIKELENEINRARAFISDDIITMNEELLKSAEKFFVDLDKHETCFDESKEERNNKLKLRDIAYDTRKTFKEKWNNVSEREKDYLLAQE